MKPTDKTDTKGFQFPKIDYVKWLLWATYTVFVLILISFFYLPKNQHLRAGSKSPQTIYSPRHFEIQTSKDESISEKQLNQKIKSIKPVYQHDVTVETQSKKTLLNLFLSIQNASPTQTIDVPLDVPVKTIKFLRSQPPDALSFIEFSSQQLLKNIYLDGIYATSDIKNKINAQFRAVNLAPKYRAAIYDLLTGVIHLNMVFDEKETQSRQEEIRRTFVPQTTTIKKGQPIIYKGDELTGFTLEILEKTGLYRRHINIKKLFPLIIAMVFIVILTERLLSFYFYIQHKKLMLVLTLQSLYVFIIYMISAYNQFPPFLEGAYLIPVTLFSFLFAILLSIRLSLFLTYINAILMLVFFQYSPLSVLYLLLTNLLVLAFIRPFKSRREIPLIGILVGLLSFLIMAVIRYSLGHIQIDHLLIHFSILMLNAILSIILAVGTLPYLEELFGLTTDLKLLDYSDLNNPLMKRLLNESPGTYYHSLMVANLAEAAAEAINANGVLARVAAYYHDIGKLKKPDYFIENQQQTTNPHDNKMPTLSALTILSHPKDGLELAKKYSLPKEIQNVILEHHGTSLLVYFYFKMLRNTVHEVVEEDQFRYDCPRPSSRESAIIMLADSVEAAVRALEKPTPPKIESLIQKIVRDKLSDSQLDHSMLTLADLEVIQHTFLSVMVNQYHSRIKYPGQEVEEEEKPKPEQKKPNDQDDAIDENPKKTDDQPANQS